MYLHTFCLIGFVVEFFSFPVIAGFTSAAATQIASSQIKSLLGIPGKANEFLEAWETVFSNIGQTKLWDTLLGVTSIIVLMLMRVRLLQLQREVIHLENLNWVFQEMRKYGTRDSRPEWSSTRNNFGRAVWLVSLARNAIVVLIGTTLAWILYLNGSTPFKLTGICDQKQNISFSSKINEKELGKMKDVGCTVSVTTFLAKMCCYKHGVALGEFRGHPCTIYKYHSSCLC